MNILVVRNDKLGDFITALPTFYTLKKENPQNRIFALISPLNRELAEHCDFIDEAIVDHGQSIFELSRVIKRAKIDASITLFSNTRVAVAQFLAQIPTRIAPATKIAQIFYTKRVKQRRSRVEMAEFEYNLELARELFNDIDLSFPQPLLKLNNQTLFEEFKKTHNITKPIAAFHLGFGGSSDANWSFEEYVQLIEIAQKCSNIHVVMTFGPDEKELYEKSFEKFKESDITLYRSEDGLINFATLISNFSLFVSTSTGTYHLAALVGTPTMTFFADTLFASVKRWKAISNETIQNPYMIPLESKKRHELFERVKMELKELLLTL